MMCCCCCVKERFEFWEKAAFFPPRPKFSKEDFRQKFVLPSSFSPPLSVVPSFHFGDEMTSDNTNSFSADGGEGGKKKKGDNQGEEEIVALVKESAEKCKKCERNILSNIDAFNSKFLTTPKTKTTTVSSEEEEEEGEEGEAALQRARKYVQALKGMVQDLESVAEDVLMNVETNFSSSRRRSTTTTDGFDENNDCEEKIRNIVRERKFAMKRVQSLFREAQAKKQRRDVEEETKKRDELLLRKQKRRQLRAGELPDSEETSVQAAKDSTDALRRARQMMHQELEKGETTLMQMTESSNTMKKTDLEYDTHSGTLKDGSQLIQTLEKQAKKERIVLWLGFFCFVTACLHVVLKRTPVLARFHPRLYFSKTKNNDTNHHHKKIDIDEKKSHHQSESESGKNPPPPRREEYAYKPTMNDDEYNQNAEL